MISVIIPVYKVEEYLDDCIRSVIKQNYTNLEIILVDDGSPDNCPQMCDMWAEKDNRIKVIHQHNKGLSGARNIGIRAAKGEYLYFLDSDDSITADCISSLWEMIERYLGVECVFAGAKATMGFEFMDYTKKDLPEYSDDRDWIQEGMLKRDLFSMTAWNRLISAEFVRKNNLYFAEGLVHEDEIWNLMISQVIRRAAFVRKNTYCYSVRENSIMTGEKYTEKLRQRIILSNKMLEVVKGYHIERQIRMVLDFAKFGVERIDSIKQYFLWQLLVLKIIYKTPYEYKNELLRDVFAASEYVIKVFISKKIHRE